MKLLSCASLLFLVNYVTCVNNPSLPGLPSLPDLTNLSLSSASASPLFNVLKQLEDLFSDSVLKEISAVTGIDVALLYTLPDVTKLTPCQWIELFEYKCEEHTVITEDGYILSVQRIKGAYGNSTNLRSHPVILSHGILTSGRDWVLSGKPESIAFELADNDVDVWLVSHRGTDLSNAHITLKTTDPGFYNFSFHEMGVYDLPAIIDYVKLENGADKVIHVGFSQGGSAFYVMFAELPEYTSANVKTQISISPAVQQCHVTNVLGAVFGLILDSNFLLTTTFDSMGHVNLLENFALAIENLAGLCYNGRDAMPFLCPLIFSIVVDYNARFSTSREMLPIVLAKSMKVTSTKQLLHYTQNMNYCDFYKYRGGLGNEFEIYNLTHHVDTELITFTSMDDHFVHTANVFVLQKNLTNTPMQVYVMDEYYHENLVFDMGTHNAYRENFFREVYESTVFLC